MVTDPPLTYTGPRPQGQHASTRPAHRGRMTNSLARSIAYQARSVGPPASLVPLIRARQSFSRTRPFPCGFCSQVTVEPSTISRTSNGDRARFAPRFPRPVQNRTLRRMSAAAADQALLTVSARPASFRTAPTTGEHIKLRIIDVRLDVEEPEYRMKQIVVAHSLLPPAGNTGGIQGKSLLVSR